MSPMDWLTHKSHIGFRVMISIILVAILVVVFLLLQGWGKVVNRGMDGGVVTITGNFACIPYKEGNDSQEDVCELGLRSKDGKYYALDTSNVLDANTDLKAEETIAVTGTVSSIEEIAGTSWALYDISGIIKVNTLLRTR